MEKTTINSAIAFVSIMNATTALGMPNEAINNAPLSTNSQAQFLIPVLKSSTVIQNIGFVDVQQPPRVTTNKEKLIGELRSINLLDENWDGQGSSKPIPSAIKDAVSFARNLDEKFFLPETMIHENGRVSLYWNTQDFYADIEFLGDKRVAYFIKENENRHKGMCKVSRNEEMPAVLKILLST